MNHRFKKIMAQSLLLGVLTNLYILSVVVYLGLYNIIWTPIITPILFLIGYFLLQKDKINATQVFFAGSLIVTYEVFVHTHFLGWNCGFYYYIFLIPTVFLIGGKWKKITKTCFYYSVVFAIICLFIFYFNQKGHYSISSVATSYINISNFTLTGFVILVVISYFSRTVLKKENELLRLNTTLIKQNDKVVNQHNNLQVLMKEIHHRVKNNLQMVNSLLRLQANEIKDENVVELFNVSRQRILSMAKLHEKMYGSKDLQHINIHEHFESLIKGLLDSYATDKEITLDLKAENINLEIDTLIPLGLMINEIITNSLKYAFINQNQGIIMLHLRSLNHQEYEMIIGDNGTGIKLKDVSDGLGSKLIKAFTKQLNGSIEQLENSGTVLKLVFKDTN